MNATRILPQVCADPTQQRQVFQVGVSLRDKMVFFHFIWITAFTILKPLAQQQGGDIQYLEARILTGGCWKYRLVGAGQVIDGIQGICDTSVIDAGPIGTHD